MKLLFDFFPILLFFIAYKLYGIYAATVVAIVASVVQVAAFWFKNRRFETMHLVSLGIIVVMGGMTIYLQDKRFIMWKPTMINWLFAGAFLATSFISQKPLIQRMLGSQLSLDDAVWRRLNLMWIGFFLLSGAANLVVAYGYFDAEKALLSAAPETTQAQLENFDCSTGFSESALPLCEAARDKESFWVNFKLFGLLGMTLVFVVLQGLYLARHIQEPEDDDSKTPPVNT